MADNNGDLIVLTKKRMAEIVAGIDSLRGEMEPLREQLADLHAEYACLQTFLAMRDEDGPELSDPLEGLHQRLTYMQAAYRVLVKHGNVPMRPKDIYSAVLAAGIQFKSATSSRSNFSAALCTSKHFVKDKEHRYSLKDSTVKWWR